MSEVFKLGAQRQERFEKWKALDLCTNCGQRPQFWGRNCILCRQRYAAHPLPNGAKRALRLYRAKEQLLEAKLLACGRLDQQQAEVLRLYLGVDRGIPRTYAEVGKLMRISPARVRQLLMPAKLILLSERKDTADSDLGSHEMAVSVERASSSSPTVCSRCNRIEVIRAQPNDNFYLYLNCGLPNVFLFDIETGHCEVCKIETVKIPAVRDLHRKLANAILLKPAALSGQEFRFLRAAKGMMHVELAERLGVSVGSILQWERSEALRFPNDLAARIVVATLSGSEDEARLVPQILQSIRAQRSRLAGLSAYWVNEEVGWVVNTVTATTAGLER